MTDYTPTLSGFTWFVSTIMGVPAAAQNADTLNYAFTTAQAVANSQLCVIPIVYQRAVYNLGGSLLLNFSMDPNPLPGGYPTVPSTNPQSANPLPYWQGIRQTLNLGNFRAGVVNAASDEGTSTSLTVPAAFENLTIGDLQQLGDPYGRAYLAIAQDAGSLWGLS